MEREINLLSCDELEVISGGATKLLDINVCGARFEYYDNGTGVGTTYFGYCITPGSGGKTVCDGG